MTNFNDILAAIASIIAAIAVILLMPAGEDPSHAPSPVATLDKNRFEPVTSLYYEKVEADATRIFRYQMTIDRDGVLRVIYDDVPGENRHVDKSTRLSDQARERIAEIFSSSGWRGLDGEYEGIGICVLGTFEGDYPPVPPRKPNRIFPDPA